MEKKQKNSTFYEGVFFLVLSIYGVGMSLYSHRSFNVEWKLSPYLFPLIISVFLLVLSLSLIFKKGEGKEEKKGNGDWKSLLLFSAVSLLYLLIYNALGFILSSIILLSLVMIILGERRWWFILLLSVITSLSIYFLFAVYLSVMLPKGRVFWYLGL